MKRNPTILDVQAIPEISEHDVRRFHLHRLAPSSQGDRRPATNAAGSRCCDHPTAAAQM